MFALCIRGRKISLEAPEEIDPDGVLVNRLQTLGGSAQASFAHGDQRQTFTDRDERLALEEVAVEAMLVLQAGHRARRGQAFEDRRVIGSDGTGYRLVDFGYPTEGGTED